MLTNACLVQCLNSVLNVKGLVGAFNQERALVGAFSVIMKTDCGTDGALHSTTRRRNPEPSTSAASSPAPPPPGPSPWRLRYGRNTQQHFEMPQHSSSRNIIQFIYNIYNLHPWNTYIFFSLIEESSLFYIFDPPA